METKNLLNKKITQWLLLVAMLVGCSASAYAATTYYYRGSDNGWGATEMTASSDGYYCYIQSSSSSNQFKIATSTSSYDYNCSKVSKGFNGTNVQNIGDYGGDNCYCWQSGTYYIILYYPNTDINTENDPKICASTTLPFDARCYDGTEYMYFDPSACSWYLSDDRVPGVSFDGGTNFIASTADIAPYYKLLVPEGCYSSIVVGRVTSAGGTDKYNEFTMGKLSTSGTKNLVKIDNNSTSGTWDAYVKPATFTAGQMLWLDVRSTWGNSGKMYVDFKARHSNNTADTYTKQMTKVATASDGNMLYVYMVTSSDESLNSSTVCFRRGDDSNVWNSSKDLSASDVEAGTKNGCYVNGWDNSGDTYLFTPSTVTLSAPTLTMQNSSGTTITQCDAGDEVKFSSTVPTVTVNGTNKGALANPLYTYTFTEGSYSSGVVTDNPKSWTTTASNVGEGTAAVSVTFAVDGSSTAATTKDAGFATSGNTAFTVKTPCPTINKPVITTTPASICTGTGTTISISTSQTNANYQLYAGNTPVGSASAGTGNAMDFSTGNLSQNTTFTVKATSNVSGCTDTQTSDGVLISITPNANPGTVSLSSSSVCLTEHPTVSVTGNEPGGGTPSWTSSNVGVATINNDGTGLTLVASGSTEIRYTITGGCGTSPVSSSKTLTVKRNNVVGSVKITNPTIKVNGNTTAEAEGVITDGGSGTWTSSDENIATVDAGGNIHGVAIGGPINITYTVSGGCGSDASAYASLNVITDCEQPNPGTIESKTICAGTSTTLTVTGYDGGTTLQWFKGGEEIPGATGYSLNTGTLDATTTYKVRVSKTESCYNEASATVTVTPLPTVSSASGNSICGVGDVTFTASVSDGSTVHWYAASTDGSSLSTDNPWYVRREVVGGITYYAEAETSGGCKSSERTPATATVKEKPSVPSIAASTEDSGCGAGTVKFTASDVSASSTVHWYENSTKKGEGNPYNYNDVAAGSSVTLKAKAVHTNGCESEFTAPTTGTRKALPSLTTAPAGSAVTAYLWEPVNLTATTTDGTATVAISTSSTKYEVTDITNGKSLKAGNAGDTFTATYTATSTNGCQTQEVKTVTAAKATEDCSK